MSSKITVVLWQSSLKIDIQLFGRPVWHSTLAAVRKLRSPRILFVSRGEEEIDDVEVVGPEQLPAALGRSRKKVLLLSAELACVQPQTLRRLITTCKGNRCLSTSAASGDFNDHAPAFCTTTQEVLAALKDMRAPSGLESLVSCLGPATGVQVSAEDLLEVRTAADWSRALQVLRRRKAEKLLASGVFIEDPSKVHIDPNVRVGRGTRIGAWVTIEGESRLGANCDVGPFNHIVDSDVGAGTLFLDYCFVRSSRIGKRAQIGPFAHVRPESAIGDQAKVGNFVELKKTTLGRGAKAPHLTYLGDATVGSGANVGAGTITCNYDGRSKHQTIIGDGAFIGSDVQLVAPVRVGKGAYVAAGSCIVDDVPAESLALARSRQVIKPGWVSRQKSGKKKS